MSEAMKDWALLAVCPECQVGSVFAVKNKRDGTLCAYCEECDTLWRVPEDIARRNYIDERQFEWGGYATVQEAVAFGWAEYAYRFENGKWVKYTDNTKFLGEKS